MQMICPVCNGILVLNVDCPNCGYTMTDLGVTTDYFGPYSPYGIRSWPASDGRTECSGPNGCAHVLECLNCACHSCKLVEGIII